MGKRQKGGAIEDIKEMIGRAESFSWKKKKGEIDGRF